MIKIYFWPRWVSSFVRMLITGWSLMTVPTPSKCLQSSIWLYMRSEHFISIWVGMSLSQFIFIFLKLLIIFAICKWSLNHSHSKDSLTKKIFLKLIFSYESTWNAKTAKKISIRFFTNSTIFSSSLEWKLFQRVIEHVQFVQT
jgi:hypothetical protein